ncbi:MAG TPA: hypothetical protein VLD67_14755 [Vicinamibacterales bacterium]|nr:hypothetical protein [Vicinamibacterales bacterium]
MTPLYMPFPSQEHIDCKEPASIELIFENPIKPYSIKVISYRREG